MRRLVAYVTRTGTGSASVAQGRASSRIPWGKAETRVLVPYAIDQAKVRIIGTSFPIPGSPIAYRGNLPQGDKDTMLELFLSINDQPRDGNVWRAAAFALGGGIARLRKADDSAYDELRKIPAAIGIDIKTLR